MQLTLEFELNTVVIMSNKRLTKRTSLIKKINHEKPYFKD